jgi:hypothetical protein
MLRADRLVGKRPYFTFLWPTARVTASIIPSREPLHFTVITVITVTPEGNPLR